MEQFHAHQGQLAQEIKKLNERNGLEMQVHGSSNLIHALLKYDLVDEFLLKIFPITLGIGKRLFGDGAIPAGLKLIDSRTLATGVVVASYKRAGKVKTGSFDLERAAEIEIG